MNIPVDVSASIGGGLGLKPMTVCATRSKHGAVDLSGLAFSFWCLGYPCLSEEDMEIVKNCIFAPRNCIFAKKCGIFTVKNCFFIHQNIKHNSDSD